MKNANALITIGLLKDHKRRLEAVLINPLDKQLHPDYQAVTFALNMFETQNAWDALTDTLTELTGNTFDLIEDEDEEETDDYPWDHENVYINPVTAKLDELGVPDEGVYRKSTVYYEDDEVLIH